MSEQAKLQGRRPIQMPSSRGILQRSSNDVESEESHKKRESGLQRAAVNTASTQKIPPIVHEVLNSPGQPLNRETLSFMEPRFAHDFSEVRVHTGTRAAESARAVNARAYTVGQDVVFDIGWYSPGSMAGKKLLAHELTHVVQQSNGARTTEAALEIGSPGDISEQQADEVAASLGGYHIHPGHSDFARPTALLQRQSNAPLASVNPDIASTATKATSMQSAPVSVNPEVANLPWGLYVDKFVSVYYDIDYRHEDGNLSRWLRVNYSNGTTIDIHMNDIIEQSMTPQDALSSMAHAHVGPGDRIFPKDMNSRTTPRLWAAKQSAIEAMEEYNVQFIKTAMPAVMFIITMPTMVKAEGVPTAKASRRPISRPISQKVKPGVGQGEVSPSTPGSTGAKGTSTSAQAGAKELEGSGPIPRSLGAASRAEMLAKKLGLNINSPTTRQVLNNLDMPVKDFIGKFRKGSILSEFPGEFLEEGMTVENALLKGGSKVRKLLVDGRFAK